MINRKYQEDNKRIFKNTVFMTIRLILMMFIGLYTSRIILEVLGVEDYGTYNVVAGFVIMFSIFTSFLYHLANVFCHILLVKGYAKVK